MGIEITAALSGWTEHVKEINVFNMDENLLQRVFQGGPGSRGDDAAAKFGDWLKGEMTR